MGKSNSDAIFDASAPMLRNTTSEIFVTSMEGQVWRSVGEAQVPGRTNQTGTREARREGPKAAIRHEAGSL